MEMPRDGPFVVVDACEKEADAAALASALKALWGGDDFELAVSVAGSGPYEVRVTTAREDIDNAALVDEVALRCAEAADAVRDLEAAGS